MAKQKKKSNQNLAVLIKNNLKSTKIRDIKLIIFSDLRFVINMLSSLTIYVLATDAGCKISIYHP